LVTAAVRPKATILVVEDNRDLCENLAEILEARGYDVVTAFTARRGVELAQAERPPDVALVDLNLPDGRGMDVVAELHRRSPQTASIILTGNASLESAVEAVNRGAYAYLIKGGRVEELMSTVERAAEKIVLEREKAELERALREERNFSRAIISNAALGIAVLGPTGRVLELNRHMRELLGGAQVELHEAEGLIRLAVDAVSAERFRAILTGEKTPREPLEVEVIRPDAGRRMWRVSTSTVTGEAGRLRARIAVFTDVTEERELQKKIVSSSRLAAIGEMAARVAHEIRNPLAGIAGAIRVLSRGLESDPKREAFSRELLALVNRLNAFVEDLLVYARPLMIAKESVTLERLLAPLRHTLTEHPLLKGIHLEIDDRLGKPLHVDTHHFAMALQNLILNAAQALKGKGRVRLEVAPAANGTEGAIVAVVDEGPGIAPELLPDRLFEPFATTRPEGTGLGLSTTRRIIEGHGGTIQGINRPEGGARFEIRLPP
jgi:PAS domain S-box-containing protein